MARDSPIQNIAELRDQDLRAGRDFFEHAIAPHNAAAVAVVQGELDAAIIGSGPYRIMAEETRARQRELQMHLQAFAANTSAGQKFMAQYRYGGFKPISATELKAMAVYADQAKRLLAGEK